MTKKDKEFNKLLLDYYKLGFENGLKLIQSTIIDLDLDKHFKNLSDKLTNVLKK